VAVGELQRIEEGAGAVFLDMKSLCRDGKNSL